MWNKEEHEDDREQKRLRDGEREEWKATMKGSEEEMKGYGERAWSRQGKVKENRIKRLGFQGSEKGSLPIVDQHRGKRKVKVKGRRERKKASNQDIDFQVRLRKSSPAVKQQKVTAPILIVPVP